MNIIFILDMFQHCHNVIFSKNNVKIHYNFKYKTLKWLTAIRLTIIIDERTPLPALFGLKLECTDRMPKALAQLFLDNEYMF